MRQEIRICGFGGQGIILAGVILGESATRAGLRAVQTQSYGPESRGGAARAEVIISDGEIDYPRVTKADIIVALSQPSFDKYAGDLAEGGVVIVDADLVDAEGARSQPFQSVAEEVGYKIVTNIVMLGYLGAFMDLVPADVFEATVLDNVPKGTEDLNRRALEAGRALFAKGGPA
jgi:2-oxoglutarate ferredoxin oxidoreductase subunit gamma